MHHHSSRNGGMGRITAGIRSASMLLVGFLVVAAGAMLGAGPASAHGGPIQLNVASDAAGGIIVGAIYTEDEHVVTEIMDLVATAVSSTGEEVGPIALMSASEGIGLWESPEPFMSEGDWTVTVTTSSPSSATVSVPISVRPIADAVVPGAAQESAAPLEATPASGLSVLLWIIAGAVVFAVLLGMAITIRRRREGHVEA
jgi:hypothetical protein